MRGARESDRGRTRLAAVVAVCLAACATGEGEPDAAVVTGGDVAVAEEGALAVDAGRVVDTGTETDVGAADAPVVTVDIGTDVGFDAGRDVGTDVGADVGCVGSTLPLAGNWRVAITPFGGGAAIPSLMWFTGNGAAGALAGGAVDTYGYAELTAVTADACAGHVTYTKRYVVGSSAGLSFRYAGPWSAGPPPGFSGTWVDVAAAANTSTYTAQSRSGRTSSAFAGAWRLSVTWTVTRTTLTVGATGALTGTMVDHYGTATLQGAVDLTDGTVMFVKRYTSGTSLDQQYLYVGVVNAAGTQITAGRWSDQGASGLTGAWTAAR